MGELKNRLMKEYKPTITELFKRPVFRNDFPHEYLNKMTNREIKDFFNTMKYNLKEEGVPHLFPDWQVAILAKLIDRDILYNLLKMGNT